MKVLQVQSLRRRGVPGKIKGLLIFKEALMSHGTLNLDEHNNDVWYNGIIKALSLGPVMTPFVTEENFIRLHLDK